MSNYRRSKTQGGTWFFTLVSYRRRSIFTHPASIKTLREMIQRVRLAHPFIIDAWVLLPDHMHFIWTLPQGDNDYSKRIGLIKAGFTQHSKNLFHREEWMNDSKRKHRESTIWQRRFWEHEIRNEQDYSRHMDYVHVNPLKHAWVNRVIDWPYSSFHRYVKLGVYPHNWAGGDVEGDFGE